MIATLLLAAIRWKAPEPIPLSEPFTAGCLFKITDYELNASLMSASGLDRATKTWHWLSMRARWVYHKSAHTTNSVVDCQSYHMGTRPNVNQGAARNFYGTYPTGTWHQVAISSTRAVARYYLDGVEVGSIVHAPPLEASLAIDNISFGDKGVEVADEFVSDLALSGPELAERCRREIAAREQIEAYRREWQEGTSR